MDISANTVENRPADSAGEGAELKTQFFRAANLQTAMNDRARILHASAGWGMSDDGALMDAAVVQIGELYDALEWLEGHLRETPHHNAPPAANARRVMREIRGEAW